METINDIQRILWHELGHFFIDLLEIENNSKFFIDDIWISYYWDATSDHKWAGGVKTLPEIKWEAVVEDSERTSFTLINLISGCIFQTHYANEVLKHNTNFFECFCLGNNCAGRGDLKKFNNLIYLVRKRYGNKMDQMIFLEKEIPEFYYENLLKNKPFLTRTDELIKNYSEIIFERFCQTENQNEFQYHFKDNNIESLKDEANSILTESSFKMEIIELKEKIKKNILA